MLKNYFTVALRSLLRHKGYSLLNVAGLTLDMACCLAMSRWIEDVAYRVELGPGAFLLSGALALGIAVLTVSTIQSEWRWPILKSLRYE